MIPLRLTFDPALEPAVAVRVVDAIYAVLGPGALDVDAVSGEAPARMRELAVRAENPGSAILALHGAFLDEGLQDARVLITLQVREEAPMTLIAPAESAGEAAPRAPGAPR